MPRRIVLVVEILFCVRGREKAAAAAVSGDAECTETRGKSQCRGLPLVGIRRISGAIAVRIMVHDGMRDDKAFQADLGSHV